MPYNTYASMFHEQAPTRPPAGIQRWSLAGPKFRAASEAHVPPALVVDLTKLHLCWSWNTR